MKQQVVVIHGGDVFDTYKEYIADLKSSPINLARFEQKGWRDTLPKDLGKDFEVIAPEMPSWNNAKYLEWELYFKNLLHHIRPNAIFIGHSLGGIFLAKYFSENKYSKNIRAVILLAAPYAEKGEKGMADFVLPASLWKFSDQVKNISLYHSIDDPIVTFADLRKYTKALPTATERVFKDRGHFISPKFPEIVREIKEFSKK
jgi:predicted alpha/beta hydrolase family esterase